MSQHNTALVPIETWNYASPDLKMAGKSIDIGLFSEALLYYDCVLVNVTNQLQFAEFLTWFIRQGRIEDFFSLVQEGSIKFYDYAFLTAAIEKNGTYSIWNIQDPIQERPNTFEQRFLYHPSVETLFAKARHRKRLYEILHGKVIEVKSTEFGRAIENAREDYKDENRNTLVIQTYVDELYRLKALGKPPVVKASTSSFADGKIHRITWNVDFNKLTAISGKELNFHNGTPLTAGAHSNRLIWSAANLCCDLYLPSPMSTLVGDKLYESTEKIAKRGKIIEELKARVEFPDIRNLVNSEKIGLPDLLEIRKKSRKFRDWLQTESCRDRDAIIAYHNEVARDAGIVSGARKALNMFGLIGGSATGSAIGAVMAGPVGGAVGGAVGSTIGYLADVTSKIGADWKPVAFGDWLSDRIKSILDKKC